MDSSFTPCCSCSPRRANFLVWTILILYPMVGMGLCFLSGTFLCRHLIKKNEIDRLFHVILPVIFLLAVMTLLLSYRWGGAMPLIVLSGFVMFVGCGVVYPAGMGKGMSLFRHLAGSATAIMNVVVLLVTSVVAFFSSFISVKSLMPLAWIYFVLTLVCVLSYTFLVRQRH